MQLDPKGLESATIAYMDGATVYDSTVRLDALTRAIRAYLEAALSALSQPHPADERVVSMLDPMTIIAGIKQFGLASDGSAVAPSRKEAGMASDPNDPDRNGKIVNDFAPKWDTNHDGYRAIFNAALAGICANPNFFGPIMQQDPRAAVDFANEVTLAAIYGDKYVPVHERPRHD